MPGIVTRRQALEERRLLEAVLSLSTHDIHHIADTGVPRKEPEVQDVDTKTTILKSDFRTSPGTRAPNRVTKLRSSDSTSLNARRSSRIKQKSTAPKSVSPADVRTDESTDTAADKPTRVVVLELSSLKKKDEPASATTSKPRVSNRVRKTNASEAPTKERTKLRVKLTGIQYERLEYKTLKKWGLRRGRLPKDYWPYSHHPGFKLGHDPWSHLNWPAPDEGQIRQVHRLLADHHKKFEFDSYVAMPAHATDAKVTIDAIFQTLFAQSTDNEIAIDTHSRLCNTFPYLVGEKKYVGKMPNWHDIRHLERDELPAALQQGGFHEMRAGFVKEILDTVYQKNLDRKLNGRQSYEHDGNPPDAKDFVPGMLSMNWLTDPELDNSDEAILGRLIQLSGIGIKSAMCVMAFSMKRPLFVVDVHVLRYAQWLGWVPRDATNVDWVAMYLHKHIPDDIKYDLHNQIWTHCANENSKESKTRAVICPFCGARPPARARDVSHHTCPLAEFLPPLEKRWGKAYTIQLRREKAEAAKIAAEITEEDAEVGAKTPALKQSSIKDMFRNGLLTPPSSPMDPPADYLESSQEDSAAGADEPDEEVSASRKKPKKLNLQAKSHRFEDISKEQGEELRAAGYYLWEFRPMDNTFMEEWGTFDKKPRYKWERDTIMDRDVAVTWEYADSVINHGASHKWSRLRPEDIEADQIIVAME